MTSACGPTVSPTCRRWSASWRTRRWPAGPTCPPDYGSAEGQAFLTHVEPQRLAGTSLTLVIGETLRGAVGITDVDWRDRRAEVGYWVAASHRGRGLASRAVRLLSTWALSEGGFERLDLYANPANQPSQRVAGNAGFTREGLLRQLRYRHGEREDLYVFSRLARDL